MFGLDSSSATSSKLFCPPAGRVQPVVTFAHITGWRIDSEVLSLLWRQVDFAAGEVRLDPGTTKNGDGRTFPMTLELRTCSSSSAQVTDRFSDTARSSVPARLSPERSARPEPSRRVRASVPRGRMSGAAASRSPANRRSESRASRHPGARRNADDGAQDAERVRALQHRERRRPSRCRAAFGRVRGALQTSGDNFGDNGSNTLCTQTKTSQVPA